MVLIVNPRASSVTPRRRHRVEQVLRTRFELDVATTTGHGHARELAAAAAAGGVAAVAVMAGDGTLNEAASGVLDTETALAPIPGGSTNVFARSLGYAYDPAEAASQVAAALRRGSVERVGVGTVGDRLFLFHLGAGFDAAVVRRVEQRPQVKRYAAHPAFAVASVATWLHRPDREASITATADVAPDQGAGGPGPAAHETILASGPLVVISNTRPYTYVGRLPLTLAPGASLDTGLSVTVATSLAAVPFGRTLWSALRGGRDATALVHVDDVDRVVLESARPFAWQVDGEPGELTTHLEVAHRPDALRIVRP
jgi:diacylglycerol kinase family enzyme